jgi:hypothetical protein
MSTQELTYKSREIVITTEGDQVKLLIDGEDILVQRDESGSKFIAPDWSFKVYPSVMILAKDIVDNVLNTP